MKMMEEQYQLVTGSRRVLMHFIAGFKPGDLLLPVPVFNNKTIADVLTHVAATYSYWIAEFALKEPGIYSTAGGGQRAESINRLFDYTDALMERFFRHVHGAEDSMIKGTAPGRLLEASPFMLFTHVITHEFHHKGQIMSMGRLLGYTPPDADIIRPE